MFNKIRGQAPRFRSGQSPSAGSTGSPQGSSGQSTVEYILLVTAVIAVMIFFTTNKNAGLQGTLNSTLDTTSNSITEMANRLTASHAASKSGDGALPTAAKLDVLENFGN